jgi:hypothetical protein
MLRTIGLSLFFGVVLLVFALAGLWVYVHLVAGLTLSNQPGVMRLPSSFKVIAEATNSIAIRLNGFIDAEVPLQQTLKLPVIGRYDADVVLDTEIPIAFTVVYKGVIPVDTMADVRGTTDFTYQKVKRLRNVAFAVKLPLQFEQPVSFKVPVNTKLRFKYKGRLQLALNQVIEAPVDTVLKTRLNVNRTVNTPVLARFGMLVSPAPVPVPVVVQRADLRLALGTLKLQRSARPDPAAPEEAQP